MKKTILTQSMSGSHISSSDMSENDNALSSDGGLNCDHDVCDITQPTTYDTPPTQMHSLACLQLDSSTPSITDIPIHRSHSSSYLQLPDKTVKNNLSTKRMRCRSLSEGASRKYKRYIKDLNKRLFTHDKSYDDSFIDENGLTLIYTRHETIPFKDFSNEVRATRDVELFLKNTVLLLDVVKINLDDIFDKLIKKMLAEYDNDNVLNVAKNALFTLDNVHQLSQTIQCSSIDPGGGGFVYDQNFVCVLSTIPYINKRHVGIVHLKHPANLGQACQEVSFIVVILTPLRGKGTKNAVETGRTFATMLSDLDFRQGLSAAHTREEFLDELNKQMQFLSERQRLSELNIIAEMNKPKQKLVSFKAFEGLTGDIKRRWPYYKADYLDSVSDKKTIHKVISTTFFLYFACMLPSIAFGLLNSVKTKGILNVEKVLYTQTFGGLLFYVFGGTPQVVLLTTAPLALYTGIIFHISETFGLQFRSMYCCVGLWNSFFLILYSIFNVSDIMRFSTRSTEEIFALFISIAFAQDAFTNVAVNFHDKYNTAACKSRGAPVINYTALLTTAPTQGFTAAECHRDISILYVLLLFGTVGVGVTLFNFTKTPYLTAAKREFFSDYSLPTAVILMSFFGSYIFRDVNIGRSFDSQRAENLFVLNDMKDLSVLAVLGCMGLGFCLSMLFYMGQNICAKFVNAPHNRMRKGPAYHLDLLVIAIANGCLSLVTFPWLHAALPHSPLHVRALADMEIQVEQGDIHQIVVRVRETRVTGILSHILIGLSLFLMKELSYIPSPVLYGVFLYLSVTALFRNQIFDRITLFFTEQHAYPPNHYIRRVPQKKMHIFTIIQILQVGVVCTVGFFPIGYVKMFFPVLIILLIPFRHKIMPKLIHQKYLNAMDGH